MWSIATSGARWPEFQRAAAEVVELVGKLHAAIS